jgi:hypothetical protein
MMRRDMNGLKRERERERERERGERGEKAITTPQ